MHIFQNAVITKLECTMLVHFEKGRRFTMEDRSSFGLSLCTSGKITYWMHGKSFSSTPDTAILLPKGASYTLHGDQGGVFPLINFQCEGLTCDEIQVFPLKNLKACLECFEGVKRALDTSYGQLLAFREFYGLLTELVSQSGNRHGALQAAIRYIEQNIASAALSNRDIATHIGVSEVYLRKLFLRYLQETPKQYILNLRMQKARQLLTETRMTVTTVAEACGFSNVYHFSREFRQRCGMSPKEYGVTHRVSIL